MNFCSLIFLFIVLLSVLIPAKENTNKKDIYNHDNKNSSSNFHKNISSVKCATKEPVYNQRSKNDNSYEKYVKYNKEKKQNNLDKGRSDEKYSKNILNNKNNGDIFESVKRVECCDYKNKMVELCNVISSSNTILKKTSRITRFKNKLYKMVFKRNKFWRVISGIITVLGDSAIICDIIMVIGFILKCFMCLCSCACSCTSATVLTLITASGGALGVITLIIILIIAIVWFLVTWLWSHKDVYYETHDE
ncbi:Plasmodium exported protein (hyp15), unknown, putative [Plasmodium sp. gorilla clade G3]|nr:Plasmodium exported protein (hyp15), unknown, putative [Plasmodium sp. gorilla clade G3]